MRRRFTAFVLTASLAMPAAAFNEVQFRVLDEGGQPLPKAKVRFDYRNLDGSSGGTWTTNALGLTERWDGGGASFSWIGNFLIIDSAGVDTLRVRDTVTSEMMEAGTPLNESGDKYFLLRTFRLNYSWTKSPFPGDSGFVRLPSVPYQIVYDPPGDQSSASLTQESALQTSVKTSFGTSAGASLSFGYAYEAPFGIASAEFEVSASVNYKHNKENEFTATVNTSKAISTPVGGSASQIGPGRGDVYVAPSLLIKWHLYRAYKPKDSRARPDGYVYKLFYKPVRDTSTVLMVVTADYLRNTLANDTATLAAVLNSSAIDPATGRIRRSLVNASGTPLTDRLVLEENNLLFSGGPSNTLTFSKTVTQSNTVSYEFEVGAEVMAKISAGGATAGAKLTASVTTGKTENTTSTLTRSFSRTLGDDDPWDQIKLRVYRDTRFGVFVFDVDSSSSWTSLPHEPLYSSQAVRWDVATSADTLSVSAGSNALFTLTVTNRNRPDYRGLDTIGNVAVSVIRNSGATVTADPSELVSPRGVAKTIQVTASAADTGTYLLEVKLLGSVDNGTELTQIVPLVLRVTPSVGVSRAGDAMVRLARSGNLLQVRGLGADQDWQLDLVDLSGRTVQRLEGMGSQNVRLPSSSGVLIARLRTGSTLIQQVLPAL